MNLNKMKKDLINIKLELDEIEMWLREAMNLVYHVEENIRDIEDQRMNIGNPMMDSAMIEILKEAASGMGIVLNNPPRLLAGSCDANHIAAVNTYQEELLTL